MKMTGQSSTSVSILLWGPPFTGKTVLASQFPNPHFIALDKHCLTSVRGLRAKYGLSFDINLIELGDNETTDPDFLSLVDKIYAKEPAWEKTKRLIEAWCRTLPSDATLVIDNLSRIGEDLTRYIAGKVKKVKFTFDEWNLFLAEMQKLIDCVNHDERKCNVIIIGHEKPEEDQISHQIHRYLLLPGQTKHRLPSTITDYIYMTTKPKVANNQVMHVRTLCSKPTHDAQLGSRSLIPDLEWPTYQKMIPYLEAALGRKLPEPTWTPLKDE